MVLENVYENVVLPLREGVAAHRLRTLSGLGARTLLISMEPSMGETQERFRSTNTVNLCPALPSHPETPPPTPNQPLLSERLSMGLQVPTLRFTVPSNPWKSTAVRAQ